MANKYRSVLASGGGVQPTGNAQPADVLAGKTFSNADGIDKTGTMVNRGAVSGTATPSQPYTIPAGYHNGSGTVSADIDFSSISGNIESDGSLTLPCNIGDLLVFIDSRTQDTLSVTGGTVIATTNTNLTAVLVKATSTSVTCTSSGGSSIRIDGVVIS